MMVRNMECESALTLAVNVVLLPVGHMLLARAGMTSKDGRCKFLDSRADGYVRSEGLGAALFVPEAEGAPQNTHSVCLCSSAVRADGRSASLTAPNGEAQVALLRAAMGQGALECVDVQTTECHGTGTALGDPIEITSLATVLMLHAQHVGPTKSIAGNKASVGHMEPAAGMAGLFTLIAALPTPNAQLHALNRHVARVLQGKHCLLRIQPTRTHLGGNPLSRFFGGVSSFGYAGTIGHVLVRINACEAAQIAILPTVKPLFYQKKVFDWLDDNRTAEVINQSKRALRDLDALVSGFHEVPTNTEVVVVGAGLSGLFIAHAHVQMAQGGVVIIERTRYAGGVWRLYANATSRVNSSEPSYRLPVVRKRQNTNHSHRFEIINDVHKMIEQMRSGSLFCMQAEVRSVALMSGSWYLSGSQGGSLFSIVAAYVWLCTARRLGFPRNEVHTGEGVFRGQVVRGLFGDAESLHYSNKRVVILGMGAFAIGESSCLKFLLRNACFNARLYSFV